MQPQDVGGIPPRGGFLASGPARVPVLCVLLAFLVLFWDRLTEDAAFGVPSLAVLALAAVVAARAVGEFHDGLNSLTILLALCLLRIGLPAVLLEVSHLPRGTFLRDFGLTQEALLRGEQLAAGGTLAVIVGWYACPAWLAGLAARLHGFIGQELPADPRLLPSGMVAFGAGLLAALVYLVLNFGDPLAAATSGVARGSSLPGTSRYGFAAVGLLITSAVILAIYLGQRPGVSAPVAASPALLATVVLTIFGGRVGALTPLVLALIGIRYVGTRARGIQRRSGLRAARATAVVAILATLLFAYVAFVPQYRGGNGISAAALTASELQAYGEYSVWTEIGTIHPYALADRLGPGSLKNRTYPEVLGAIAPLLGVERERPGRVMVERFGPSGFDTAWGFQTGLIVDVFTNTSLVAALLAGVLFGLVLRAEYTGFRRAGPTVGSVFLHCFLLWTLIWVYFESIVVLPSQIQVVLPITLLILLGARLLPEPALRPGPTAQT